MNFEKIATLGLVGVAGLQLLTLLQGKRNMAKVEAEIARLETAINGMSDAVTSEIGELQTLSVELQNANSQTPDIDLTPQIDRITALTQRLSASLPANTTTSGATTTTTTDTAPSTTTPPAEVVNGQPVQPAPTTPGTVDTGIAAAPTDTTPPTS